MAIVIQLREVAFGVVLVWAFWGIVAARPDASAVVGAAAVATLALAGASAYSWRGGAGSPPVPVG
jgi:hypothetical protein